MQKEKSSESAERQTHVRNPGSKKPFSLFLLNVPVSQATCQKNHNDCHLAKLSMTELMRELGK